MIKVVLRLLVILLASLSIGKAQAQDLVLTEADQMPYFAGCEMNEKGTQDKRKCSNKNLVKFIANTLKYPVDAKSMGLEGTVYVSFVVDETGTITNENVLHDIGGGCGAEALRVLENMPKWEPAVHEGEKVKMQLNLPIRFSLKSKMRDQAARYKINWGTLRGQQVDKGDLKDIAEVPILVRDELGETIPISQLIFTYEKGTRFFIAQSKGTVDGELQKILKKCKKGGTFTIKAVIQQAGKMIEIKKKFEVV